MPSRMARRQYLLTTLANLLPHLLLLSPTPTEAVTTKILQFTTRAERETLQAVDVLEIFRGSVIACGT